MFHFQAWRSLPRDLSPFTLWETPGRAAGGRLPEVRPPPTTEISHAGQLS